MDVSRRTVLAGLGGLGLAAAVSGGLAEWAQAAPPLDDAELVTLRNRWVDLVTGRNLVDPDSEVFTAPLAEVDGAADDALATLDTSPDRASVFTDLSFSSDSEVAGTYYRLRDMATAWATPGCRHHGSDSVLAATVAGLQDTHRLGYHAGREEFGNWWSWEIGASRALADTMAILRDHIEQGDLDDYCAAIDFYVPDPWYQFPESRGQVVSTGANRVDLCRAVIVRSVVGGDVPRLQHAVAGLTDTWQYVTSGDGFYRDGSFVQHTTVPYTGTYGLVLLGGLSRLFALLAGTGHDITDPSRVVIDRSVDDTFAPLVYRNQMMDSVRGRAISREGERSIADGDGAIESILRLAGAVDDETAARWRGLCRQWIEAIRNGNAEHDILDGAGVVRTSLVHALWTDEVAPVPDAEGPRMFAGMDRLVHRGADNRWALAVAMCSKRITWYECGNGENNHGARTSSGMTYLYLPNQDDHFDDEYWPTCDLTAPCGTTVDTTPLPPKVEGEWGSGLPDNEWTGGSAMQSWSLAGQHLIGPGGTGLQARKTWFAGEDFVACLGSDIVTGEQFVEVAGSTAVADAHVNDGSHAGTNYGSNSTLLVKTVASPDSGYTRQTFLRFTPEPVTDPFDAVMLQLYARVNDGGGDAYDVDVHRCESFDEQTVTWDTRPAIGEHLGRVHIGGGFAWCSVDLTDALRDTVVSGGTVTLALTQDLPDGRDQGLSVEIRSRETGSGPRLAAVNTGATTHGRVKTVVEHRNLGTDGGRLLVDGTAVAGSTEVAEARWAHLAGTAGYVFLQPATVRASLADRTGSWSDIHVSGSDTEHTRRYATVELPHGSDRAGTYAYLVLPGADLATTRAAGDEPSVRVLANTAEVQACASGPVTAANFWRAGTVDGITVDRPATVLARRTRGTARLSVSDPTRTADTVVIDLADVNYHRATGDGVSLQRRGRDVRITIDVRDRIGVAVDVQLFVRGR